MTRMNEGIIKAKQVKSVNRLTSVYWRNADLWQLCGLGYDCKRRCVNSGEWCKVALQLRRLAAYEDTGMMPEEINALKAKYKDIRNELCIKCGKYKEAHNGACDGCRWEER